MGTWNNPTVLVNNKSKHLNERNTNLVFWEEAHDRCRHEIEYRSVGLCDAG